MTAICVRKADFPRNSQASSPASHWPERCCASPATASEARTFLVLDSGGAAAPNSVGVVARCTHGRVAVGWTPGRARPTGLLGA